MVASSGYVERDGHVIWEVSKVNIYFVAVLLTVLLMCTYIPSIPLFLVDYFYN